MPNDEIKLYETVRYNWVEVDIFKTVEYSKMDSLCTKIKESGSSKISKTIGPI